VAIAISTIAILPSWADAKVGAAVNLLALAGVAFGYLIDGPASLRAEFDRDVAAARGRMSAAPPVTDDDIAHLPPPVQRYLHVTGAIGQPRVRSVHARMSGRIRSGPNDPWMPIVADQDNFFDEPARFFYLDASRMLVPLQGLHRYVGRTATMRVKAAGLIPVVSASGPEMTRAETVTMFNDMCILAPATLIDPTIRWEGADGSMVRAAFTNAGETIRATLVFNDAGELVNFWSDDRKQVSIDGTSKPVRWSTPMGTYRQFGHVRIGARGEARWHEPDGEYAYIEITIANLEYNRR
jgi:hypothetical protein